MAAEDGVRCAIRSGVPIVEDGSDFFDPYDPWVARRVGPHDDLVAQCVAAADRRFDGLRSLVRSRIARLVAAAGTSANEVTCRIEPTGFDLQIDLYVPAPIDRRLQQALAVRALDAVHASAARTARWTSTSTAPPADPSNRPPEWAPTRCSDDPPRRASVPEDMQELPAPEPAAPSEISTWPLIFGTVAVLALAVVMTIAALVAADDDDGGAAAGEQRPRVAERVRHHADRR